MCNGKGHRMWIKSLNLSPELMIRICLMTSSVQAILLHQSSHNHTQLNYVQNNLEVIPPENQTHREGRCKSLIVFPLLYRLLEFLLINHCMLCYFPINLINNFIFNHSGSRLS